MAEVIAVKNLETVMQIIGPLYLRKFPRYYKSVRLT